MKFDNIQGRFKVLPVQIQYIDVESNEEKSETINVKYRPLTSDWFSRVDELNNQLEKNRTDSAERIKKLGEILQKQNLLQSLFDTAKDDEKEQAQADLDAHKKVVEQERALLDSFIEESRELNRNLLAKQLQPVILDLDLVDEAGEKIKPTLEVMNSLDYELLYEILNGIKKKMTRE